MGTVYYSYFRGLCLLLLWLGISQGYPEILVIFAEMLFPLLFLLSVLLPYLHRRKEAAETWDAVTNEDLKYINASPREIFHQVLITMDGLISRTVYGDVMIRFPDIVWVYGVDTQHRINGINSGKSSGVIIGTRNHKRFYVLYDQKC